MIHTISLFVTGCNKVFHKITIDVKMVVQVKRPAMFPVQRRQEILKIIKTQGTGAIPELSNRFGVSEMTIRRDLQALEKDGFLRYTRGGAVIQGGETLQSELGYTTKKLLNSVQKQCIARYAAEHFVDDNDIVVLEPGTTVTAMASFLTTKTNLTVVTNGLYTTNELQGLLPHSTVICTGGILRDVSHSFVGPLAERFFSEFYAGKLFLSGVGFTLEAGLTDPQMIDTQVKKAMINAVDEVILLIDSSKFGVKSFTQVIGAYDVDVLITDEAAPQAILGELSAHGIDVRIAPM